MASEHTLSLRRAMILDMFVKGSEWVGARRGVEGYLFPDRIFRLWKGKGGGGAKARRLGLFVQRMSISVAAIRGGDCRI